MALPPGEREVMELKIYAELTFREIAAVTGANDMNLQDDGGQIAAESDNGLGPLPQLER